MGFPGGSAIKNLPAIQEIRVQSLGQEDPLEKVVTTHSSILAWEIPCTEEPGATVPWGYSSRGWQRVRHDQATKQQNTKENMS